MNIGIPASAANQASSKFDLPRGLREELEREMDAHSVRSRRYRAAVVALATFVARHWSHPDRMNGCFALARESKRGRHIPRFYQELGLSEWVFRVARDFLLEIGFLEQLEREGSAYRWTAWGISSKPHQYRLFGRWRDMLDQAWAVIIEAASLTPAQRLFRALQLRRKKVAEQNLRNTELRSKGLSTIPEVSNFVAPRGSPPTLISAFNLAAAGRGPRLE